MHTRAQIRPGFAVLGRGLQRLSRLHAGLMCFGLDLIAPTALLYVLLWCGSSLYLTLLASASVSVVSALVSYRSGAGNGRFAPYMLAMAIASFTIALVTGNNRFLLAKESVLTAIVGRWFLASIWLDRPLTYVFTRQMKEFSPSPAAPIAGVSLVNREDWS